VAIEGLQRSDAELLAAVRAGEVEAYGALYNRHAVAALAVARRYTDSVADAEDVVADSFTAVYTALQRGRGPTEAFRAYLFTVVRRVATLHRDHGRRVQPTDDDQTLEAAGVVMAGADAPALAGFESTVVARAFTTLPERWQLVLWHTEVEGLAPAQVAPLLGLSANSASALAYRAREGLRQAYLTEHLASGVAERCRPVADKLGAYVRGGLGPREARKIADHIRECASCRALHAELGDVNHGMRTIIGPLVLGMVGLGALDQLLAIGGGVASGAAASGAASAAGGSASGSGTAASAGAASAGGGFSGSAPLVAAAAAALVVVAGAAVFALNGRSPDSPEPVPPPVASAAVPSVPGGTPSVAPLEPEEPLPVLGVEEPVPVSSSSSTPAPPPAPVVTPTSAPTSTTATAAPTATATATPTATPTVSPTVTPTPPAPPITPDPAVPAVGVDTSGSLLALQAGLSAQDLRLVVHNTGGDAKNLVATITVPDGIRLDGAPGPNGGGQAVAVASWVCAPTSTQAATCTLGQLAAGETSEIVLKVTVGEDYDGTGGSLQVLLSNDALELATQAVVPVTVAPAPARLVVAGTPVTLVANRTRPLVLDVSNAGGMDADQAAVVLHLPVGVHLVGPASPGWTCLPTDVSEVTCTATVARRSSLPLEVPLSTVSGGSGAITISYPGGLTAVPCAVVEPATLAVSGPANVGPLTPGVAADVALVVTNTGELASGTVTVDLALPPGLVVAGTVGGGWTCAGTACTHDGLAPGASVGLTVPLAAMTSDAVADLVVTASADDADGEPLHIAVLVDSGQLTARVSFTGNARVVQVGAPLMSCSLDPQCPTYLAGAYDNDSVPMSPLDVDPPSGPRPSQPVSSTTTLTYPGGQDVLWAGLYWSANAGPSDAWSTDRTTVLLHGPGQGYQHVDGTVLADFTDSTGWHYYQSFADVTAQVAAGGGGAWSLADAAVAATTPDPSAGYYAGWALVVVYGNPNGVGSRTVTVYDGGQWVTGAAVQLVANTPTPVGQQVTVGAVAWEGDAATSGDTLALAGVPLTPMRGGAPGSSSNAFDSWAAGWTHPNSLGVDAKAFAPVHPTSATSLITASAGNDRYLLGVVTVTSG